MEHVVNKYLKKKESDGGMDWISLAQNRDRRRELVIMAMKLRVL
jgi:hypothetical protein